MRLYKVAYTNAVGHKVEWFNSKDSASRRRADLNRQMRKWEKEQEAGEDNEVTTVYDIEELACDVSAKGVIHFLNHHCYGDT